MKKVQGKLTGLCFMMILLMLSGAQAYSAGQPGDLETVAAGNTEFALDSYSLISGEEGNIFFSPYSISSALAMTYAGARGKTAEEMAEVLNFRLGAARTHRAFSDLQALFSSDGPAEQTELHIANSLWPQEGFQLLPEYRSLITYYYGAAVEPVDYAGAAEEARVTINTWVEEKTAGNIQDLITPGSLDPAALLVLVNAVYFNGSWASRFDPDQTRDADFHLSGSGETTVSMMHQRGEFRYGATGELKLLELPYADGKLSMVIILPEERDGLAKVEEQLNAGTLEGWLSILNKQEVEVYLPRFSISWGTADISSMLKTLGMQTAFGPGADFSGIDGRGGLFVSRVLHKAFIDVNEEGTEAAAATAVLMKRGMPPQVPEFRADHPFLFMIQENSTGSLLFLGRTADPGR